MSRLLTTSLLALALLPAGCINRWNTRLPSLHNESTAAQRRDAIHDDPFPDDSIGPEMGFRPPGYETTRSDPLRTKNDYISTMIKLQKRPQPEPVFGPGAQYPGAVPAQ